MEAKRHLLYVSIKAYFKLFYNLTRILKFSFFWSIFAKRIAGTKASRPEAIMSVQDIAVQSQALINVKDSNKVWLKRAIFWTCLLL